MAAASLVSTVDTLPVFVGSEEAEALAEDSGDVPPPPLLVKNTVQMPPRISRIASSIATHIHTFGPRFAAGAGVDFTRPEAGRIVCSLVRGIGAVVGSGEKRPPEPKRGAAEALIGSAATFIASMATVASSAFSSARNWAREGTAFTAAFRSRRRIASTAEARAVASLGRCAGSFASRHIISARAAAGMLSGSGGGGSFT